MIRMVVGAWLILLLGGCSSTFVYNNLDWLVHWYLDDYVDLDRDQKARFDEQLQKWLIWHRQEELARYQAQLQSLREAVQQEEMDQTQWLAQFEQAHAHWNRLLQTLAPELASLATSLQREQVEQLFDELEAKNRKAEQKWQNRHESSRLQERIDELQEDIRRWVGPISAQQQGLIAEYAPQFYDNVALWIAYRRAWQHQVKSVLTTEDDNAHRQRKLVSLFSDPRQLRSDLYRHQTAHNTELYARLLASLHATLTDKQRHRALKELQSIEDDIAELME